MRVNKAIEYGAEIANDWLTEGKGGLDGELPFTGCEDTRGLIRLTENCRGYAYYCG